MARILLVDDDADFRKVTRRMLERAGHTVTEAPDGNIGMGHYREQPADLVIMDMYMPAVDGIEAIIRIQQEFPDIRIIATSGGGHMDQKDVLETAAQLGARRTLPKPFTRDALLAAVEEVLAQPDEPA
jgi:CheY-like chemotaxis protein